MNNIMDWIYTFASVTGTSHIKECRACQDNCTCEVIYRKDDDEILIAVASDGAGSAECGETGSRLICSIIKEEIINFLEKGFGLRDITREIVRGWIVEFQKEVLYIAKDNGRTVRDYACTLIGAIVGLHEEVYFQIGDGAIVVLPRDFPREYKCIFWPQRGEYENTTFFATDKNAVQYLKFIAGMYAGDEIMNIAMFTDGIQRMALHYESHTPFAGFFGPMFRGLDALKRKNIEEINAFLERFLSSEKVNCRTDDDKTLILAARFQVGEL